MPYEDQYKIVRSEILIRENDLEISENDYQMFHFDFGFHKKFMEFEIENKNNMIQSDKRFSSQK